MNTKRIRSLIEAAKFASEASVKEAARISTILDLIDNEVGYVPPFSFGMDVEGLLVQDNVALTCQFGNPSDTSGYRPSQPVRLVAIKNDIIGKGKIYLITDDQGLYGVATPCFHLDDVEGVLYCTMARRIGELSHNVTDEEHAKHVFGF